MKTTDMKQGEGSTETLTASKPTHASVQQCERCEKSAVPSTPVVYTAEVEEEREHLVDGEKKVDKVKVSKTLERPKVRGFCKDHGGVDVAPFTRTAEAWAELRGHFPEWKPAPVPKDKPKVILPPIHNPNYRFYSEARFGRWGGIIGKEMTLAEYDAHVEAALNHIFR